MLELSSSNLWAQFQKRNVHSHTLTHVRTYIRTLYFGPNNTTNFVYCQWEFHIVCHLAQHSSWFQKFQQSSFWRKKFSTRMVNLNRNYDANYNQNCFVCRNVCVLYWMMRTCGDKKIHKLQQVPNQHKFHFCFSFLLAGCKCVRVNMHVCGFCIWVLAHIWTRL